MNTLEFLNLNNETHSAKPAKLNRTKTIAAVLLLSLVFFGAFKLGQSSASHENGFGAVHAGKKKTPLQQAEKDGKRAQKCNTPGELKPSCKAFCEKIVDAWKNKADNLAKKLKKQMSRNKSTCNAVLGTLRRIEGDCAGDEASDKCKEACKAGGSKKVGPCSQHL